MGTSAFFSDTEEFDENTLTAGALNLKVDWEEHYSDWSDDEAQAAPGVRMVDAASDVGGTTQQSLVFFSQTEATKVNVAVTRLTGAVTRALVRRKPGGGPEQFSRPNSADFG